MNASIAPILWAILKNLRVCWAEALIVTCNTCVWAIFLFFFIEIVLEYYSVFFVVQSYSPGASVRNPARIRTSLPVVSIFWIDAIMKSSSHIIKYSLLSDATLKLIKSSSGSIVRTTLRANARSGINCRVISADCLKSTSLWTGKPMKTFWEMKQRGINWLCFFETLTHMKIVNQNVWIYWKLKLFWWLSITCGIWDDCVTQLLQSHTTGHLSIFLYHNG